MKYLISFLILLWIGLLGYKVLSRFTTSNDQIIAEIIDDDTLSNKDLETFVKYYGGPYTESANDIIVTSDGGFLLIGSSTTYTRGSSDILIIKVDRYGELIWSKRYGTFNMENAVRVKELKKGGYVLTGHTNSYGGNEIHDMLIMKIDSLGAIVWKKIMGGNNEDYATNLIEMPDGNLIITGYTYSYGVGQDDIFIMKMKENGDTLWTQMYGGLSNEHSYSVDTTGDGFAIVGFTKSFERKDLYDVYVVKTNLEGIPEWSQVYGGDDHDRGQNIFKVEDGYIIGGSSMSSGAGLMDLFICKLDLNGDLLWTKTYGTPMDETTSSMSLSNDGGILLVGITNTDDTTGTTDLIAIKTDFKGDTLWTGIWGGPGLEAGHAIIQTIDNKYAIAAKAVPENDKSYDFLLIVLDENGFKPEDRKQVPIEVGDALFHQDTARSLYTRGIEIRNEFSFSNAKPQIREEN
ncbi:MAG: hypothetical protein R2780_10025 [Crocinitomicaceae bacterium]|nr:hypothetical protein [Crocinitomicaceae bacterium]